MNLWSTPRFIFCFEKGKLERGNIVGIKTKALRDPIDGCRKYFQLNT